MTCAKPFAAALLLLAASCAWSVPADPGENSRLRADTGRDATSSSARAAPRTGRFAAASDDGAREVYMNKCSKCHEPFPPSHAEAGEWPALVRRYGPRAGLFGEERERVLRWLQANAGR